LKKKWDEKQSNQKEENSESFIEKNVIRVIDNLILSINRIHIRVESFKRGW